MTLTDVADLMRYWTESPPLHVALGPIVRWATGKKAPAATGAQPSAPPPIMSLDEAVERAARVGR